MPTLTQVQTESNTLITTVQNLMTARQSNFLANRLTYWQGLPTHSAIPSHTTSTWNRLAPDRLNTHPTDQFDDWIAVIPDMVVTPMACAFIVNVYEGPSGKGYELVALFHYNGAPWERHINVGPDLSRNIPWTNMS